MPLRVTARSGAPRIRTLLLGRHMAVVVSTAALAGAASCSAPASQNFATGETSAPTTVAAHPRAGAPAPSAGGRTAPSTEGSSEAGKDARASRQRLGSDKATQVTMSISNATDEVLELTSSSSSGEGNHWQKRPITLPPGGYELVSNYAAGDAAISLTYVSADTHTTFKLSSETPLVGGNSSSGSSSSTSYAVNYSTADGYDPTNIFSMDPGHTFGYTGQPDTFTVPAGVTRLGLDVVGGSGGSGTQGIPQPSGAEITGTIAVTPGQRLTVAVGGMGGSGYPEKAGDNNWTHTYNGIPTGGWGLQNGDTSYGGGSGYTTGGGSATGGYGGGGASVVLGADGQPLLIAGGGGGISVPHSLAADGPGGQGGYQGQLIGGAGSPNGGQPGSNHSSQGEDISAAGGAGGGGLLGGMAGPTLGSGGGAGSSFYSPSLTDPAIRVGHNSNTNSGANSSIVITGEVN